MNTVDSLMHGAIDMHLHCGPDPNTARSVDAFQAAAQAEATGMRAIVLKSHDYPTAPLAILAAQTVRKLTVFGSLSLDFAVGGLNPAAVEASALLGAKVVWMPTFSAAWDRQKQGRGKDGIMLTDERGNLLPVTRQILEIIKKHEMVVATGHISLPEIRALVSEATRLGIDKMVITHAMEPRFGASLNIAEQKRMAAKGAFIEHCYLSTLQSAGGISIEELVEAIKVVGAEHCILTTDLGQKQNPPPAEGMRMAIDALLQHGLTQEQIALMIKGNPARLLGLAP